MASSIIKLRGLMVKALDCHAKGPWFKSHQGHQNSLLLQKLYIFFTFFKNLTFNIKNYRLSNQFWFYKHGVRNASFQRQSHLKYQILIWVTLYYQEEWFQIFLTFDLSPNSLDGSLNSYMPLFDWYFEMQHDINPHYMTSLWI